MDKSGNEAGRSLAGMLSGGAFIFKRVFTMVYVVIFAAAVLALVFTPEFFSDVSGKFYFVCFGVIAVCLLCVIATRSWRPRVSNTANTLKALRAKELVEPAYRAAKGVEEEAVRISGEFMIYKKGGAAIKLCEIEKITIRNIWRPLFKKFLDPATQLTFRISSTSIVSFRYPKKGIAIKDLIEKVKTANPNVTVTDNTRK